MRENGGGVMRKSVLNHKGLKVFLPEDNSSQSLRRAPTHFSA
jgi:hypothetical protein